MFKSIPIAVLSLLFARDAASLVSPTMRPRFKEVSDSTPSDAQTFDLSSHKLGVPCKLNIMTIDLLAKFTIDLLNQGDTYYSVPFNFGSNYNRANLIIDTNSDWVTVSSTECSTCYNKNYNR
jgi:hypothetical protein